MDLVESTLWLSPEINSLLGTASEDFSISPEFFLSKKGESAVLDLEDNEKLSG